MGQAHSIRMRKKNTRLIVPEFRNVVQLQEFLDYNTSYYAVAEVIVKLSVPHLGNGMVTVSQPNLITMSSSVHTIDRKSQDCRPNLVTSLK